MNDGNLIPFSRWSKDDLREISHKGGIQSGISRRKKAIAKRRAIDDRKIEICALRELSHELKLFLKTMNRE